MDAIEPVYGTATLLIIAAVSVALLLFLIMKSNSMPSFRWCSSAC